MQRHRVAFRNRTVGEPRYAAASAFIILNGPFSYLSLIKKLFLHAETKG